MPFWDSIVDGFKSVGNTISSGFNTGFGAIRNIGGSVFGGLKNIGTGIWNTALKPIYSSVVKPAYENVIRPVGSAVVDKVNAINRLGDTVLNKGTNAVGGLLDVMSSPIFYIVAGVAGIVVLNKVL